MPIDITEIDEFTAPVVRPAGTDVAGLQYLITALQALANRSKFLKRLADTATLQKAFDASVTAGDSPTIDLGTEIIRIKPAAEGDTALLIGNSGTLGLMAPGTTGFDGGGLFLSASPGMSLYGLAAPLTENTTSKAALVRAAGSDMDTPSEWMPMDWGDTAGRGTPWTPTISGRTGAYAVGGGSDVTVIYGCYSRVGDIVTVSAKGTATASVAGPGSFQIAPPAASNFDANNDGAFGVRMSAPSVTNISVATDNVSFSDKLQVNMIVANTSSQAWEFSGQYVVLPF